MRREIEDVLAPGERLLWEGRPSGVNVFGVLSFVVVVAGLGGAAVAVLKSWHLAGNVMVNYTLSSTWSGSGPAAAGSVELHGLLLRFLGFAAALCFAIQLVAAARWRARRYGVTDRRVVVMTGRGKVVREIP
jgi:hypothetical protein